MNVKTRRDREQSYSLEDIARAAGCSKMTVSRVLRGERHVAAATAERVRAEAERLGYRENPMVRALMAALGRKRVAVAANLAWVVAQAGSDSPRLRQIREGARRRAEELGFGFERVSLAERGLTVGRAAGILKARGVRGVVIAPLERAGDMVPFPWSDWPVAAVGRSLREPVLHHVMHHFYHGAQRVLSEVAARGYRRIGLLNLREAANRSDSAQEMVFLHFNQGRAARDRVGAEYCDEWTAADFSGWLRKARPDAVVAAFPSVLARLREAGAEVPGRMGFAALSWWPELSEASGLSHPFAAMGAAAVDLVVAQIHRNERGVPERAKSMLIEGDWIEGATLRAAG